MKFESAEIVQRNKTRYQKKIMENLSEATIIIGKFKGEDVLIPRIPLLPTNFASEFKLSSFWCALNSQYQLINPMDNL